MKLIFLHGLGQDVLSWQGVQFALSPLHSKTFDIFSHPSESYQEVKERLMERLPLCFYKSLPVDASPETCRIRH